ncbi:protein turtle homolog B-like [Mytilus edulis]|uniref:protein turtle homolog B-like n=1 Tax=Mytilus edulis TaxID=6550 RepID=UPI0039EF953E
MKPDISNRLNVSSNCTLRIINFKKEDVGKYKCSHPSETINGMTSHITNIQIENITLVTNSSQTFSQKDKHRILKCEVSGMPNVYKFNKWRQIVNGHPIRSLVGRNDGTLTLPYINTSDIQYDDSGIYICNVTYNNRNENGQLWQTGTVNVTIRDKPVLVKPLKQVYIGHNISTPSVALYLLSSSELSASTLNEGGGRVQTPKCAATAVNTQFHGVPVNVSGYICNVSLTETKKTNFQNYSVTVSNECCNNTFHFSIRSAREPVQPKVFMYDSSTTDIHGVLEPGSDGGLQQEFIIEYRKQQNKDWKWLIVENIGTSRVSFHIPSLDHSTAYEFRIRARNSIGNSSSTDTLTVRTKGERKSLWGGYTIVIVVTTVLTVCSIIICWRRRKASKNVFHRSQIVEQSNQGGAIENSLYQSASDLTEPSTASGIVKTDNRSIDRKKTNVDRQIVGYNIVEKEDNLIPFVCKEFNKRGEQNMNYDSSTLNYVEVVFDPAEAKSTFQIHGAENRTPYADIDFSLTADPLTSSDEESLPSHEDNTDFVSLEDVQQWNIHES